MQNTIASGFGKRNGKLLPFAGQGFMNKNYESRT